MAGCKVHKAAVSRPRVGLIVLLMTAGMLITVGGISPVALLVALRGGSVAAGVVLAATGLGLWIVRGLKLHGAEVRWQLLLGAGLGLGAISLLVLGLGSAGVLDRAVWVPLLVACMVAGLWRVRAMCRSSRDAGEPAAETDDVWMRWLWLAVIGFGGLALLAGTMPPGILWPAEGNGYDVLEYHLGVPREHFEAGRISYLPHNIYGNFPFNVEMLYLLAMVLHGGPISAVFTAKLLNVLLGMLAVGAVWLAGREFGRGSGIVAGVTAASCPFLTYLCGVAYVENGLLFFAAMALGALLHAGGARRDSRTSVSVRRDSRTSVGDSCTSIGGARRDSRTSVRARGDLGDLSSRWGVTSGLLCGLACGCKYTAIPVVFLPLAISAVWMAFRMRPARPGLPILFLLGWAVAFGPWAVKNTVATGNPVFPLLRDVFPERAGIWNEDGAARWHEGHLPAPEDRPLGRRFGRLWHEVLAAPLFGPAIGLAILAGLFVLLRRLRNRVPPRPAGGGDSAVGVPSGAGEADGSTGRGSAGRADQVPGGAAPSLTTCWLMFIIGVATWLGLTHLAGRFAVVLVVPAAVILGGTWRVVRGPTSRVIGVFVVLAVVLVNLTTTMNTFRHASVFEVSSLRDAGHTDGLSWFTGGQWPWHAHVPRLNALAADGRKVLMVGDARRLYLDRNVDYCVVFNRNPFAEAAEDRSPAAMIEWLRGQGYGYVYVDWVEMRRLRGTRYGFWSTVDADLFRRMTEAGLERLEDFSFGEGGRLYGTLFKVANGPRTRPVSPFLGPASPVGGEAQHEDAEGDHGG
ncbi:MAG: hypothetical protein JXQ75_17745 [Phycisphaerae bacterium]|nr:hypothetical protein [Phycisphaerae bacterium]